MRARAVFGVLRLAAASVCIVALVHRMFWGLSSATIAGENFFAYLTVQSNCALVGVLLVGAVLAFRRTTDPRWFTVSLALVLTWTITAGLAFALIVWQAGLRGIRVDVPWSDQVLHFYLPACTAVAWVLTPGHRGVPWWVVPTALAFPLAWGGVTLWRGPIVGWYPYYFLDPRQVSGPPEFLITSGIALAIFAAVASVIVLVSRMRRRGHDRPPV
ncbi:Pr6Pr family membrane protein [Microbacterium hydrocarbonoxydans]|uniref:Pr6Pr family membrane protein n=1 Tax=Microbacterium hydrocarbonoxydans TaxID=273678 RepID=UPI00203DFEB8|nr:Pr6Pr family membrane protein [Microbacterium hydrocarbonoxydans]MCM3780907.1 Pr6Pr family membrane protein [Microbacterium hydrocarbonoxydans]